MSRVIHKLLVLIALLVATTISLNAVAQSKRDAFVERIANRAQRYVKNLSSDSIDKKQVNQLLKYWNRTSGFSVTQQVIGDVVISHAVNDDGKSFPIWYGEGRVGEWTGWGVYACRGCCKGHTYWAPGRKDVFDNGKRATIRLKTWKINPETCKKGEARHEHVYDLKQVKMLRFKEHLPGKIIHIVMVAAPAQYKASVKIQWNANFKGVSAVTVRAPGGARGRIISDKSTNLSGEYEYLTMKPGKANFILEAYDQYLGRIHMEHISVKIPRI